MLLPLRRDELDLTRRDNEPSGADIETEGAGEAVLVVLEIGGGGGGGGGEVGSAAAAVVVVVEEEEEEEGAVAGEVVDPEKKARMDATETNAQDQDVVVVVVGPVAAAGRRENVDGLGGLCLWVILFRLAQQWM